MTDNTFTIRELTKRGFERRKDLDFRDDGNAFKCLTYKGFRVTYLKDDDTYYLSIDVNISNRNFTFEDMFNTDWYKLADEFNGVSHIDVNKFIENFDVILKGMDELERSIVSYKPDVEELERYLKKEIEMAENEVAYFKANYNWYEKASQYSMKWDIDRVKYLEKAIAEAKKIDYSKMSNKQLREVEQRIARYQTTNHNLDGRFVYDLCK